MVKRLETLGGCSSFGMNMSHGVHAVNAESKALTFCCESLENNSGEVRKAAVESLAFIGTFTGRSKVRDKLPKTLKSSIRDAVERAVDAKVLSVEDKKKTNDDELIIDLKKKPSESATKNQTTSSRVAVEKEAASKVFEAPSNSFEFKKKSAASETDKAIFSRPREGEKQPEVDSEDDSDDDSDDDDDEDDYPSIEELQQNSQRSPSPKAPPSRLLAFSSTSPPRNPTKKTTSARSLYTNKPCASRKRPWRRPSSSNAHRLGDLQMNLKLIKSVVRARWFCKSNN